MLQAFLSLFSSTAAPSKRVYRSFTLSSSAKSNSVLIRHPLRHLDIKVESICERLCLYQRLSLLPC
jgi:hypothetical protein